MAIKTIARFCHSFDQDVEAYPIRWMDRRQKQRLSTWIRHREGAEKHWHPARKFGMPVCYLCNELGQYRLTDSRCDDGCLEENETIDIVIN